MSSGSILRDPHAPLADRRAELEDVLQHLTIDEIRFLKSKMERETLQRDFIPVLPVEIILHIAGLLDPSEITRLRQVSQAWRRTWTSISICDTILKNYFRVDFERFVKGMPAADRDTYLRAKIRLWSRSRTGMYHSMAFFPLPVEMDSPSDEKTYCSGRVAYWKSGGIEVHCLRSGRTRIYRTTQRELYFKDIKLSDRFVVAASLPNKLHAWSLDGDEYYAARIPSRVQPSTLQGDRLAMITRTGLCIWRIGQELTELPLEAPGSKASKMRARSVVLHPHTSEIYVVWVGYESCQRSQSPPERSLVMSAEELPAISGAEYTMKIVCQTIRDGRVVLHDSYCGPLFAEEPDINGPGFPMFPIVQPIDESGSFLLGYMKGSICEIPSLYDEKDTSSATKTYTVYFNIYRHDFSFFCFEINGSGCAGASMGQRLMRQHLIMSPAIPASEYRAGSRTVQQLQHKPILAAGILDTQRRRQRDSRVEYGWQPFERERFLCKEEVTYISPGRAAFFLGLPGDNSNDGFEIDGASLWAAEMRGDDHFSVLLTPTGYVVWSFEALELGKVA